MSADRRPPLPLLLLLAVAVRPAASLNCLQDNDPGEITPRELNVLPGQKFHIACNVELNHPDVDGRTSEDLYFTREYTDGVGEARRSYKIPVSDSGAKRNGTTLVIEDRLQTAVFQTYTCHLRARPGSPNRLRGTDRALCTSLVYAGYNPLDVKNFSCIVDNWMNITCSWKLQENAIKSYYQLQYLLEPSYDIQESPPRERWVICPEHNTHLRDLRTACSITEKSQPVYRSGAPYYNFTMNITNALGTRLQWLGLVSNFAIVKPAAPKSVRAAEVSTSSVLLETEVGFPMNQFPRPLDFSVIYTSRWDTEPQSVDASPMRTNPADLEPPRPRPLLVTGLRPHTAYRFAVKMRSSLAVGEYFWSEAQSTTVLTPSTVPAAAPEVDPGSFQLQAVSADSRTVLLYWRQIAAWQQNGPDFTYCVTARDAADRPLRPDRVTEAYARFERLQPSATTFWLASCNAVGRSVESGTLRVPDQRHVGTPPHSVTLRISGLGGYQLFWKHEDTPRGPDSFTLFACEQRPDWTEQCQGQLQMWRVSGDARQHNLTLPIGTDYQFAVSANYAANTALGRPATSSGMVWSRCYIPLSRGGDQVIMGLSVQSTGERSITLAWSDDCDSQAAISRVVVIFCELRGNKCKGEETTREISQTHASSVRLPGLRPFTRYRVWVALITAGRRGPRSSPLVAQTLQARSEPPKGVEVSAVTNSSLTVYWHPPSWPNGPLQHYEVLVRGGRGDFSSNASADVTWLEVTGLLPFAAYNVSVRACNTVFRSAGCSRWARLEGGVRTRQGAPGEMEPLRTRLLNTSAVLLRWRRPLYRGGPRQVYLVRTVSEVDGRNFTQRETVVQGNQLEVPLRLAHACRSGARSQRHLFWVRAGTVLPSGQVLPGPWSEPVEQNCVLTSDWPMGVVLGTVAGCLLLAGLAVLIFCLCSRTKSKWVKMRDIGVNLPSGLERPEKGLAGFRGGSERRTGPAAAGYDRLVSQSSDGTAISGRPLLQDESVPVGASGITEALPSTATDSNSCSSSATNYTDSGAESEKVGSPTYERLPWPAGTSRLAPYVQAGGPDTPPAGGPVYPKFSPYVDAKAIQNLLAHGGVTALPSDGGPGELTRSEPDLSAAGEAGKGAPLPYTQIGLRSSTGYVSMASEDTLSQPPPVAKEPERPYVALGPSPPVSSASGFPPYVLAGLAVEESAPYIAPPPDRKQAPGTARPAAYVARDMAQPAGIELRDLAVTDPPADKLSDAAEPVLSPKKLATVVSAREPYCRVVTQHQGAAESGPNVSML